MSFELRDVPMRLKYCTPNGEVVDAGPAKFEEDWFNQWLQTMLRPGSKLIFFLMIESTDVFEKEMEYNVISHHGPFGMIMHTYSTKCPEGCYGQLEGCVFKKEETS